MTLSTEFAADVNELLDLAKFVTDQVSLADEYVHAFQANDDPRAAPVQEHVDRTHAALWQLLQELGGYSPYPSPEAAPEDLAKRLTALWDQAVEVWETTARVASDYPGSRKLGWDSGVGEHLIRLDEHDRAAAARTLQTLQAARTRFHSRPETEQPHQRNASQP